MMVMTMMVSYWAWGTMEARTGPDGKQNWDGTVKNKWIQLTKLQANADNHIFVWE